MSERNAAAEALVQAALASVAEHERNHEDHDSCFDALFKAVADYRATEPDHENEATRSDSPISEREGK